MWFRDEDVRRSSEIHNPLGNHGAETVDKHTSNYSLTKHTSHHQAKPLKEKIYPHLLPTSFAINHNRLLFSHPRASSLG